MNKKIKELALTSGFCASCYGILSPYIEDSDISELLEEFAQLIIKECISIAHDNADVDETYDYECHTIGWKISEHFGIE